MTQSPYRIRAEKLVKSILKQRLFLIETGKSKSHITHHQCKLLEEKIQTLRSDRQWAVFLEKYEALLLHMITPANELARKKVHKLRKESTQIQTLNQ